MSNKQVSHTMSLLKSSKVAPPSQLVRGSWHTEMTSRSSAEYYDLAFSYTSLSLGEPWCNHILRLKHCLMQNTQLVPVNYVIISLMTPFSNIPSASIFGLWYTTAFSTGIRLEIWTHLKWSTFVLLILASLPYVKAASIILDLFLQITFPYHFFTIADIFLLTVSITDMQLPLGNHVLSLIWDMFLTFTFNQMLRPLPAAVAVSWSIR